MSIFTNEEVKEVFRTLNLEENYNFLEDDLVKLANAFAEKTQQKLGQEQFGHKLMGKA